MPHSDRRHPDPQVRFHILLARRLIGDHHQATQNVRQGNSIADRRAGLGLPSSRPCLLSAKPTGGRGRMSNRILVVEDQPDILSADEMIGGA
jgi:hypothetical protein